MKRYDVVIGGNPTTLLLSDQDARARGLLVDAPKPAEPAEAPAEVPTKAKTPANKGRRTVANKRATKVDK